MTDWTSKANCKGITPAVFFVEKSNPHTSTKELYDEAKSVCKGCVVKSQCLDYALDNNELFGVWGGLSPRERRAVKRQRRYEPRPNPRALLARSMRATGRFTVAEVANELDVTPRTVERWTQGNNYERVTPEREAKPWCSHCDADKAFAKDGTCRACDEYRRKYNRLPDLGVLVKRWRMRDARRQAS